MGILLDHISKVKDPYWELLRWLDAETGQIEVHIRIVFEFHILNESPYYRLDYDDDNNEIIFTHKRPRSLLERYNIDPDDDEAWLKELQDLKEVFLNKFDLKLKELRNKKPNLDDYLKK